MCLLQVGAGISTIADTLIWAGLHLLVVYASPKKSTSVFLYCSLSKFNFTLHFLAVSSKVVNATSWSLWFCSLPTIIRSSAMPITCLILPKHWSSLHWKNLTSYSSSKWHDSVPESANLSIKGSQEWWSFIKLLMPAFPFYKCIQVMMHASSSKWAISSGVLKWYGSLVIALFRLVGSKWMYSFKLPNFSLLSTSANC